LGEDCLAECSRLTSITIPLAVTALGDECFENCSGLKSINIPASVKSLGGGIVLLIVSISPLSVAMQLFLRNV
jgi:hypothetical protein